MVNEAYFQETEKKFCALPEDYLPHHTVSQELFKTELQNIAHKGMEHRIDHPNFREIKNVNDILPLLLL